MLPFCLKQWGHMLNLTIFGQSPASLHSSTFFMLTLQIQVEKEYMSSWKPANYEKALCCFPFPSKPLDERPHLWKWKWQNTFMGSAKDQRDSFSKTSNTSEGLTSSVDFYYLYLWLTFCTDVILHSWKVKQKGNKIINMHFNMWLQLPLWVFSAIAFSTHFSV